MYASPKVVAVEGRGYHLCRYAHVMRQGQRSSCSRPQANGTRMSVPVHQCLLPDRSSTTGGKCLQAGSKLHTAIPVHTSLHPSFYMVLFGVHYSPLRLHRDDTNYIQRESRKHPLHLPADTTHAPAASSMPASALLQSVTA